VLIVTCQPYPYGSQDRFAVAFPQSGSIGDEREQMTRRIRLLTGLIVLALGVLAFAGSAIAGGGGGGYDKGGNVDSHGQSGGGHESNSKGEHTSFSGKSDDHKSDSKSESRSSHGKSEGGHGSKSEERAAGTERPEAAKVVGALGVKSSHEHKSEHKSEHKHKSKSKSHVRSFSKSDDDRSEHAKVTALDKADKSEKAGKAHDEKAHDEKAHGKKAHEKVTICHATGSATNPFVAIRIARSGWEHGHRKHGDDHVLAAGETCGAQASAVPDQVVALDEKPAQVPCPATSQTVREQVLVGVWHKTGSKKHPYVFITPSSHSAHYDSDKHADDVPVYTTVEHVVTTQASDTCTAAAGTAGLPPATVTPVEAAAAAPAAAAPAAVAPAAATPAAGTAGTETQGATPATDTPAAATPAAGTAGTDATAATPVADTSPAAAAPAAPTPADSAPAGGVAGVSATLSGGSGAAPAAKTPSRGEALAATRTATGGTLPFTGLQLLGFAILGALLVAAGLVLRRRQGPERLMP
jgi:hypothetical protein